MIAEGSVIGRSPKACRQKEAFAARNVQVWTALGRGDAICQLNIKLGQRGNGGIDVGRDAQRVRAWRFRGAELDGRTIDCHRRYLGTTVQQEREVGLVVARK